MKQLFVLTMLVLAGCAQTADTQSSSHDETQHVFEGNYTRTAQGWSLPLETGAYTPLPVEHHRLVSDYDGIEFPIGVYLPDVPEGTKVPAIVEITPYLPLPEDFDHHYQQDALESFIPHGYAVVLVGMRGTTDAGGCMDLMGPGERADAIQAMDWIDDQDWFSGNASVVGLSYPGSTPWFLTAVGHPAVKTIVPMSGLTDTWELLYHNGTTEFGFWVPFLYWTSSPAPNGGYGNGGVQRYVCEPAATGMTTLAYSQVTKERDPVYWSERESRTGTLANYEGSVFMVHGLQDWNVDPHMAYPFVNELEDAGIEVKHFLGQWAHAFPDNTADEYLRADFAELLLRWFDRELKGMDVEVGPMAQVQDNQLQWRSEESWPPEDSIASKWHLGPSEVLSQNDTGRATYELQPIVGADVLCYIACPPRVDLCDCPIFETEPLQEAMRISGMPRVHVTVMPHGPGGQISGWLFDVGPNGTERIGWGGIDLHHAAGDGTTSPVIPREPMLAKMELQPMDAHVEAGHSLALLITRDGYGDHFAGSGELPIDLMVGDGDSTIVFDTIIRGDEVFFDAPMWIDL